MAKSYEITTESLTAQPTLTMRFEVAPQQLAAKFAEVLPAVFGHAVGGGGAPAGQPFARYHGEHDGKLDVEAGVPTMTPGRSGDGISVSELPAGEAAVTTHVGPYDGLGAAHQALTRWAKDNGRQAAGGAWEVYVSDPGEEPDPTKWETRVFLPLGG